MTAGVPMTSDAGIKRSHNTDRRTLGRFLEFCIEKDKFIASARSSPPSKLALEFVVAIDPPESSLTHESNADDVTPSPYALSPPFSPTAHSSSPNVQHTSTENIAGEKRESSGGLKEKERQHPEIPIQLFTMGKEEESLFVDLVQDKAPATSNSVTLIND
ncbi:hypothetical protein CK203_047280 [Vitis vinifera]|uniref:Uncharacterized protein n=1 Tax=Vitis vinifera TaxID=29760 RepID=A0A438HZ19_VITVI|nr:hypothetical protein CK203_047280 [Vitis vinifera]